MSAVRRKERADKNAVVIPQQREAKEARKGVVQTKAPQPAKEPSARPYRAPEPVVKEKRVVRTVSERDGHNLLRKIQAKGGRDIIVAMTQSTRTPQELAEDLIRDEAIVTTSLDAYGTSKDRLQRLMVAIEQAPVYLENNGRPVTTGVKKQQRREEARAKQVALASSKVYVVPTVDEVVQKPDDQQIVLEELKKYLSENTAVRDQFMGVSSDQKARNVLIINVGHKFDARVRDLIAVPSEYQHLLVQAGFTIRREVRKYNTPDIVPAGPVPSVQESLDAHARQQRALDAYKATEALPKIVDPEVEARDAHQQEILSRLPKADVQPSSDNS